MHIDTHFHADTAQPVAIHLNVTEARRRLEHELRGFVYAAADFQPDEEEAPALALRVSPGLGKTVTALRVIAEHAGALLARGNVLFYVPTLELAEEAQQAFARIAPAVPSAVIRGRSADRPDGVGPMCRRHELAAELARLVPFVSQALCVDREGNRAPCADGCPYLAQRETFGARVLFLAHRYLTLSPPIDREVPVALRVIDESFWSSVVSTPRLPVADLLKSPAKGLSQHEAVLDGRARTTLVHALQAGLPVRAHLAGAGIDGDVLKRLAKIEAKARETLAIRPDLADESIRRRLKAFDAHGYRASLLRERVFRLLCEGDEPDCRRLSFAPGRKEKEDDAVQLHRRRDLPVDAPLLMLDASADPDIIAHLVPHASFMRIDAPARAHVVQADDVVASNFWLLHHSNAVRNRGCIARIIQREVARAAGGEVLVVATRSVLRALHEDAGQPNHTDEDLEAPLLGASPRWFGPRMRGLNRFSSCSTVVVIGRMQPPVEEVEANGRALFADAAAPLAPLPDGRLVATRCHRVMSRSAPRAATVQTHPDPNFARVLRQMREESSLQAVARLRLMSPDRAKRVVLVGSLPLDDLPVDEITCIEALAEGADGMETRRDIDGWRRLEAALRRPDGSHVRGLRLTATGLAEDLPAGAMTANKAKEFRRGRPSATMHVLLHRIARSNGWPCTSVELLAPGRGGHPAPAVVFADVGEAVSVAGQLWPGFKARSIPAPCV